MPKEERINTGEAFTRLSSRCGVTFDELVAAHKEVTTAARVGAAFDQQMRVRAQTAGLREDAPVRRVLAEEALGAVMSPFVSSINEASVMKMLESPERKQSLQCTIDSQTMERIKKAGCFNFDLLERFMAFWFRNDGFCITRTFNNAAITESPALSTFINHCNDYGLSARLAVTKNHNAEGFSVTADLSPVSRHYRKR